MVFYSAEAGVPTELDAKDFVLRPLGPEYVELDYDAFMSNRDRCLLWSGGTWPSADFTLERNLADMNTHAAWFSSRKEFSFTVLERSQTQAIGCVYIDSCWDVIPKGEHMPDTFGAADEVAITSYWTRAECEASGLDIRLVDSLQAWLREDWDFRKVFFRARPRQRRDIEVYESLGMQQLFKLKDDAPDDSTLLLYGSAEFQ